MPASPAANPLPVIETAVPRGPEVGLSTMDGAAATIGFRIEELAMEIVEIRSKIETTSSETRRLKTEHTTSLRLPFFQNI